MNRLLRLKHWQLFVLLMGIPMIAQFIFIGIIATTRSTVPFFIFPAIMILFGAVFFGWFYALGSNLHKKLPITVDMNLKLFKLFLFIPAAYLLFLCFFMFGIFTRIRGGAHLPQPGLFLFIFPVHLFSMFCIFYCLYFNAKALKAVELQRPVTFSDFAGEFFMIWFFPVGVWIIQPRINKLFSGNTETGNNFPV